MKAIKRMEGRPIVEGLQGMMGYFYMCSEHTLVRWPWHLTLLSFLDPPVLTCSTLYVDHLHDDCNSYPQNEHLASWWWCGEYCEGIIALFSNQMNKNINKKNINHTVYCEGIIVGPSITAQYQCQARHSTTPINRLSAFLGSHWHNYVIMVRAWIRVLKFQRYFC